MSCCNYLLQQPILGLNYSRIITAFRFSKNEMKRLREGKGIKYNVDLEKLNSVLKIVRIKQSTDQKGEDDYFLIRIENSIFRSIA